MEKVPFQSRKRFAKFFGWLVFFMLTGIIISHSHSLVRQDEWAVMIIFLGGAAAIVSVMSGFFAYVISFPTIWAWKKFGPDSIFRDVPEFFARFIIGNLTSSK